MIEELLHDKILDYGLALVVVITFYMLMSQKLEKLISEIHELKIEVIKLREIMIMRYPGYERDSGSRG